MGRFIVASGVNPPDTNINIDVVDPILPAEGALMLIEPGHPVTSWGEGVPESGSTVPNLASDQALAVLTGLTGEQVKPTLTIGSTFNDHGLVERTSKGGLHFARTTDAGDSNTIANLQAASAFWSGGSGLASITDHDMFISFWGRTTKAAGASYSPGAPRHSGFGDTFQMYGFFTRRATGDTNYPTDSRRMGYRASGAANTGTTLGPLLQNIGISSISTPANNPYIFLSTNVSAGNEPSLVFYRFYIEDLTVSGRTYAEVDAIDYALFTEALLTTGGRYYGDTFTDPDML